MIRLSVCLLFSTAALAQNYPARGAPSAVPMDYNDDIYNRDMRVPPTSNFIFNFEQARRDQPLQVEMREENIGKYMGRPRTTTPLPLNPKPMEQHVPEIETVHLHHLTDVKSVSMKPYVQQVWDPISSHLPATLPPAPTTPRWMDLSDESFKHHSHHQPRRHPVNEYQSAPTPAPVQYQPAPMHMSEMMPQPEMSYSNPMPQYVPPSNEYSMPAQSYGHHQAPRNQPTRGSHKFNWNDVSVPQPPAPISSTTMAPVAAGAPQSRGPPPSIPTLTPWYGDNF